MIEQLTTHEVAKYIHDAVWLRNGALSDELLATSRLHRALGHMTGVEQVVCQGFDDPAEPSHETLSKTRNGLYYFEATEGLVYTGELSMGRHVIGPSSNNKKIASRFAQSLIVREFIRLTDES